MYIQSDNSLLTHLKLPPNTCLKLSIQGECQHAAYPRLHPTKIGTLDITPLVTGLTALIASELFNHTCRPHTQDATSTLDRKLNGRKENTLKAHSTPNKLPTLILSTHAGIYRS